MSKIFVITVKEIEEETNEDEYYKLERKIQRGKYTYGWDYISSSEFFSRQRCRVTYIEEGQQRYVVPLIHSMEDHYNNVVKELKDKTYKLENELKELQQKNNDLDYKYKLSIDKEFRKQEINKLVDQKLRDSGILNYETN